MFYMYMHPECTLIWSHAVLKDPHNQLNKLFNTPNVLDEFLEIVLVPLLLLDLGLDNSLQRLIPMIARKKEHIANIHVAHVLAPMPRLDDLRVPASHVLRALDSTNSLVDRTGEAEKAHKRVLVMEIADGDANSGV